MKQEPEAKKLAPARAISVDMDGTLYRVHRLRVAWRLRWERGLLVALLAAREKIRHEEPLADQAALSAREAELVAPSFGLSVEEALLRIRDLRSEMPAALTKGFQPHRGVRSALEAAHVRGLKIAVLSDYDPEEKLRHLGLADLPWSAKLATERWGALKPHPRAFQRLAEAVGVEPNQIVHIGDSEDLDVKGALAAGMRAWRFSRNDQIASASERVFGEWDVGLFAPICS
jgi:HAD superfamily hydrolase (TIGR01509 family)